MKMWVVRLHLVIKDALACLEEFLLRTRLTRNAEVDGFLEVLGQLEVDYLIFPFEGAFQELLDHLEGFVDK